jgi:RNA:NAD 2'-phosphotransferase (TPT1/KptA family)
VDVYETCNLAKHEPGNYKVASKPKLWANDNDGKYIKLRKYLNGQKKAPQAWCTRTDRYSIIEDLARSRFELLRTMLGVTEICIKDEC